MNLFVIGNYISIQMAKRIIEVKQIKDFRVLIPVDKKYSEKFYLDIIRNLKDFGFNEKYIIHAENIKRSYPSDKRIFRLKKEMKIKNIEIEKLYRSIECKSIYLTCLDNIFERQLSCIAKQMNIEVNLYEEGSSLYFYNQNNNLKINLKKIRKKIKSIFFLGKKYAFYIEKKGNIKIDNVYCNFPDIYQFNNYKRIEKINLILNIKKERKQIDNLFMSRPLSEDKILTEEEELNFIINYLLKNNIQSLVLKPHPREKVSKIEKLIFLSQKENINIILFKGNIPSEKIIEDYDVKNLIGYETSSLIYLSELYDIKCDCLLKSLVEKTNLPYFKNYYKFYSKYLKKINYV